jgi:hypothetical protein
MLPAIRDLRVGVRRLRWVVAVFAVIAPLAFPGAASADNSATSEALQYVSTSVAPVTGSDAEYDNQAVATQTNNGKTAFSLTFKAPLSFASVITANNNANATVNTCQNCTAIAISVQTVIAAKQDLAELTAHDVANAASTNCTNCNTLAEAFQIIYAPLSNSPVSWMIVADLGKLQNELKALQNSGLSLDQIQSQSTQDIKAIGEEFLAASDVGLTPALNPYNLPAQLTSQQPVFDVLSAFHH